MLDNCSCTDPRVWERVQFWLEGVGVPLVGGLGLLGNTAAIVVLRKSEMCSIFNQLLVILAILDTVYVATGELQNIFL